MPRPNWLEMISMVCARGGESLKWDMLEPWFHAELFGVFNALSPVSGWEPFDFEVPYRTFYPVQTPQGETWKSTGAEKWVDLCLFSEATEEWYWFELKVRHRRKFDTQDFAGDAQQAVCKDFAALAGFQRELTADIWKHYDTHTTAYRGRLSHYAEKLRQGTHHCVAAFVQLATDKQPPNEREPSLTLDPKLWGKESLSAALQRTLITAGKASGHHQTLPDFTLSTRDREDEPYAIVICEWTAN